MADERIARLLRETLNEAVPDERDGWPAIRRLAARQNGAGGRRQAGDEEGTMTREAICTVPYLPSEAAPRRFAVANAAFATFALLALALGAFLLFRQAPSGGRAGSGATPIGTASATARAAIVATRGSTTAAVGPSGATPSPRLTSEPGAAIPTIAFVDAPVTLPRLDQIGTAPPFQTWGAANLPTGVRLVAWLYAPNGTPSGMTEQGNTPRRDALRQLLGGGAEPTLILLYADESGGWIEIVQRLASGPAAATSGVPGMSYPATPVGEPIVVGNHNASAIRRGDREIIGWIQTTTPSNESTFIEMRTNFDRPTAVQIANSMRLVMARSIATPSPAMVPTSLPSLAAWPKRPLEPQATPEEIAARCGTWDPAAPVNDTRMCAICIARLVSGFDAPDVAATRTARGGYGIGAGQERWSAAAARIGLDPAAIPGDPDLWIISLGIDLNGGRIVALDPATGAAVAIFEVLPPR